MFLDMHRSLSSLAAAFLLLLSNAGPAFGYTGNLVALYWGQGANQARLSATCDNDSVDIVILAFLNQFPDATPGGIPGTNFGNACGSPTFVTANGQATDFLIDCPYIGPDIDYCRSKEKILLLSLGGAGGNAAQYVANDTSGVGFANFLVGAFGPPSVTPGWTGPRPFGSSYVDGYDFDVESTANQIPPGTMSTGYVAMIARLKALGATYISWAPQCIDYHLTTNIILNSAIDFLFVQFYNTPYCSALSYISDPSTSAFNTSFNGYANSKPGIKVFIGLPASLGGANPGNYLAVSQVSTLLNAFGSNAAFGGISLWEATASQGNLKCNMEYATWMKMLLVGNPYVNASNFGQTCLAVSSIDATSTATSSQASSFSHFGPSSSSIRSATSTLATSTRPTSVATSPSPLSGVISTDGTCGGANGYICGGNSCCSLYGFCGFTNAYCGLGCQSRFGTCSNPGITSTIVAAGPTSPDGSCGGANGYTCFGDGISVCCSKWGFCGSGPAYCGSGNCQAAFGVCS